MEPVLVEPVLVKPVLMKLGGIPHESPPPRVYRM
jgi:hypothetical protein